MPQGVRVRVPPGAPKFNMKHLEEIGETWWQHCRFALRFAFVMFLTSVLLVVHAFFPNAFKSVGNDVVRHMHAILEARRNGEYDEDDEDDYGN